MALFLANLAWSALEWMNYSSWAQPLAEEALALYRELGDRRGMAEALAYLSLVARLDDDMDRAQALFRQGLAMLRQTILMRTSAPSARGICSRRAPGGTTQQLGNLPFAAYCLHSLGLARWYQGDYRLSLPGRGATSSWPTGSCW